MREIIKKNTTKIENEISTQVSSINTQIQEMRSLLEKIAAASGVTEKKWIFLIYIRHI